MSSLANIARATGLAVTTVSEILRDKPGYSQAARDKVTAEARRLEYRPNLAARQLRGSRSGLLGALIGRDNPQANFDRLAWLERVSYAKGFRLMIGEIHPADNRFAGYLRDFAARGVDGVFWLHQPFVGRAEINLRAMAASVRIVSLDHPVIEGGAVVRVDYAAGIAQAAGYLAKAGRRRIGLAIAAEGIKGDPLFARLAGFRRGLKNAGMKFDSKRIWVGGGAETPDAKDVQGIIQKLVRTQRCDAVLASNDVWAAEILRAAKRAGVRVPDDVAVIGFDNLMFAPLLDPALTTIDQRHEDFAAAAVGMMEKIADDERGVETTEMVIQPQLVIRESA